MRMTVQRGQPNPTLFKSTSQCVRLTGVNFSPCVLFIVGMHPNKKFGNNRTVRLQGLVLGEFQVGAFLVPFLMPCCFFTLFS